MAEHRGKASHLILLRALPLLAAFGLSGLFFTLLWYPILLDPFPQVLRERFLVYGLAGLGLAVGHGSFIWLWREFRLQAKPELADRPWRPKIFTALLVGLFLGFTQVFQQVRVIESNPYLSLHQYMREDVWLVWIAMAVLAMLYLLTLRWDSYLSRRLWQINRARP